MREKHMQPNMWRRDDQTWAREYEKIESSEPRPLSFTNISGEAAPILA